MSLRIVAIVAVMTAVAVALLVVPNRISDAVVFALVVGDLVGVGLVAADGRALWAAAAFAASLCLAWYAAFFFTGADSGILDGLMIELIALTVAAVAVTVGVVVGRQLR